METLAQTAQRKFMTRNDIAALFGVSPRTVDSWQREGLLPFHRVGKRLVRFTDEDIADFVKRSA
jgi:excisionase family DNA binding protein